MSFLRAPFFSFCFILICIVGSTAFGAAVESTDRPSKLAFHNRQRSAYRVLRFEQSKLPRSDQFALSRSESGKNAKKEKFFPLNEGHYEYSLSKLRSVVDNGDSEYEENVVANDNSNNRQDDVDESNNDGGADEVDDDDSASDDGHSDDDDNSQDDDESTTNDDAGNGDGEGADTNEDDAGTKEGENEDNDNDDSEDDDGSESNPSGPTVLGQGDSSDANTTNTTNPVVSGASEAFAQFELAQLKQGDGEDDSYRSVNLFENGTFTGPFANNPNTSDISSLDSDDKTLWFKDSDYSDRIAFQFRFDPNLDYKIEKPAISVAPGSGIEPQLSIQVYEETGTGTLTLFYHCVMGKPGEMLVGFSMRVTSEHSIETTWVKVCGQGRFEHVDFGFLNHESQFVLFNVDGTYGDDERKKLEVGPIDSSTDLQVSLKPPATDLEFSEPYIMSDSEDISVKLRSTVSSGNFGKDIETKFTILYDCEGKATGNVKFTVGIPPWENITATWRKDCGGTVSQALLIGISGEESFDVMQDGNLKPEFDVTEVMSVSSVDGRVKVFPTDVHSQKFYFTNSDDTSDIHFQKVSITLSDPTIMKVVIGNDRSSGSLGGVGGVLERDSGKILDLFFICSHEGRSMVLVTLPTVRYKSVEFGFVKDCEGPPKVYEHSGFMSTAGSLLDAILVLAVVGGIAFCIYRLRKRKGTSYSPVSTSEQTA